MADIARKTKRYPSDLANEDGERVKPRLSKPSKRGRKISVNLREMRIRPARAAGMDWSAGYSVSLRERSPIPGQ
jgi:hypothetical protein